MYDDFARNPFRITILARIILSKPLIMSNLHPRYPPGGESEPWGMNQVQRFNSVTAVEVSDLQTSQVYKTHCAELLAVCFHRCKTSDTTTFQTNDTPNAPQEPCMTYQVSRNGQLYGPYSLEDLQRYVATGNVLLTDLAKTEERRPEQHVDVHFDHPSP